jgi:hypothetical protein
MGRKAVGDWKAEGKKALKALKSEQLEWLRRNVDLEVGDLRDMSTEDIRRQFPEKRRAPGVSKVNDARLMRTFIWQTWLRIKTKELPPVRGNLRSFWYRYLEPFYLKHDLVKSDEGPAVLSAFWESPAYGLMAAGAGGRELSIINAMGKAIDKFVLNRIFKFQGEFEFQESMDHRRRLGRKKASTLFYTEKDGLWWLCCEISDAFGISVMASNGEPSLLTLEYFSKELEGKGIKKLHVGALCDFDPWGWNIMKSIDWKLRFFGFDVMTWQLATPDLFPEEVAKHSRRDLSKVKGKKQKTEVKKWFDETGGFKKKKWGLHVDVVEDKAKEKRVRDWVAYVEKGGKPSGRWPVVKSNLDYEVAQALELEEFWDVPFTL